MLDSVVKQAKTGASSPTYHSRTPITDGLTKRLEEYAASPGHNGTSAESMKLWIDEYVGSVEDRGKVPSLGVIVNTYTFICSSIEVEGGKLEVDRSNPFEALVAREHPEVFVDASRTNRTPIYDWCVDQVINYLKGKNLDGGYDPIALVEIQRRLGEIYATEASGKKPEEKDINFFSDLVDTEKPVRVINREFPPKRPISNLAAALR